MELKEIPGIGEKTLHILESHEITSVKELLSYFPRTHRSYHKSSVSSLKPGEWVILSGNITKASSHHIGRISSQVATFSDSSASLTLRWFNSPFIPRSLTNSPYQVLGKVDSWKSKLQIVSPILKKIEDDTQVPSSLIIPIYTPLGTLKSGNIRNIIQSALKLYKFEDHVDAELLSRYHLYPKSKAISSIHFPVDEKDLENARKRLGLDELIDLKQEALSLKESLVLPSQSLKGNATSFNSWLKSIPYTPTSAQHNAIKVITDDLSKPLAMHRLLSGDVGSGKTLVAAAAILHTQLSGYHSLVLAPTQILAEQLHAAFTQLLPHSITHSLVTSSKKGDPQADVVVGTQALLSTKYKFEKIGLLVVDEQHRFGVKAREFLRAMTPTPHLLMMSATPIPRTLAMTNLLQLDVTHLDVMPAGRLSTKTYVIGPDKIDSAYNWLNEQILKNNQKAFVVVPLIEAAEIEEGNSKTSLQALEKTLKTKFLKLKIDIMHGKMKDAEKNLHLSRFRDGETNLLVATSMIEVGIDIPNANIILIENAELFGLATLHQLRGRVGRGGQQGYCILSTQKSDAKIISRLKYFQSENNGLNLSAYDLEHRGPGDLLGTSQSGLLQLRFATLTDELLLRASDEAVKIH